MSLNEIRALGLPVFALWLATACGCGDQAAAAPIREATSDAAVPTTSHVARRVVVVGAGLSGLTAALDLRAAGWEVLVLEARERVGGRVHTLTDFGPGLHAEGGGESIDDDHHELLALLAHYGLRVEHRPADKVQHGVVYFHGRRMPTSEFLAQRNGSVLREYEGFDAALAALAQGMDPEHPERFARAAELDRHALGDFLRSQHLSAEAEFLVSASNRAGFASELDGVSLLFAAQQALLEADVPDSATETMRVQGGNARLPEAMANALGGLVQLRSPVDRVEQTDDRVRVHVGQKTFEAAYVVLAIPTPPLRRIAFQPALPVALRAAIDQLQLGPAMKVITKYRRRFWEEEQRSGVAVTDEPFGIAWSSNDSYASESGLLTQFVTGAAAARGAQLKSGARIFEFSRQLDQVYPEGTAQRAEPAMSIAWADEPYTGGGYAVYAPGQFVPFWPALRAGTARIRFAGEHLEALAGYMESAIRSGHRAAHSLGAPP